MSPVRLASPFQLYALNRAGMIQLVDQAMPLDADTAFQQIADNIEQERPVVAAAWVAKQRSEAETSSTDQ